MRLYCPERLAADDAFQRALRDRAKEEAEKAAAAPAPAA